MSWELLVIGLAVVASLVGLAAWGLTGRAAEREKRRELEKEAEGHEIYHTRDEEWKGRGGMGAALLRARARKRLRNAGDPGDLPPGGVVGADGPGRGPDAAA